MAAAAFGSGRDTRRSPATHRGCHNGSAELARINPATRSEAPARRKRCGADGKGSSTVRQGPHTLDPSRATAAPRGEPASPESLARLRLRSSHPHRPLPPSAHGFSNRPRRNDAGPPQFTAPISRPSSGQTARLARARRPKACGGPRRDRYTARASFPRCCSPLTVIPPCSIRHMTRGPVPPPLRRRE